MIRTRDFLLIFSAIMFLLTAIGGTIFGRLHTDVQTASVIEFVTDTREEFSAEIYEPETLSREERVLAMRQKIADSEAQPWLAVEETEPIVSEVAVSEEDAEPEQVMMVGISKCPGYSTYRGAWTPQEIQSSVSEGARVFYREVTATVVGATSSQAMSQQEMVLQLPLYPVIKTQSSCLSSDVVGIAQDGSLIRHNESGLYSVFGESTLIGYALDGFPIYGVTRAATDECGGVMSAGEYRYHLSDNRDSVLQCFRASPASL